VLLREKISAQTLKKLTNDFSKALEATADKCTEK